MALKDERDRGLGQLQEIRVQLEASIRQTAVEAARADHVSGELQRLRDGAKPILTAIAEHSRKATRAGQSRRRKVPGRTAEDG